MKHIKRVYSGLVIVEEKELNSIKFPFKKNQEINWWFVDSCFEQDLSLYPVTFLSSYGKVYNDFGEHILLKLQDSIIRELNLDVADFPGAFNLLDQNNEIAVAYRIWENDLIGTDLHDESFRVLGYELIMRPDIFEELLIKYEGKINRVTRIHEV